MDIESTLLAEPATVLLDRFGAGKASPGSGSAAALMGVLAAKLLLTVCIKSKERLTQPRAIQRINYMMPLIQRATDELKTLFDNDARDFARVVELRVKRDRADNKKEQTALSRQANDGLEEGTETIFAIAERCLSLVDWGVALFKEGWPPVRGDSGAAVSAALSGAMSCIFVASLNAKALRSRAYAPECLMRCRTLTDQIQTKQGSAFDCAALLSREALEALELPIRP